MRRFRSLSIVVSAHRRVRAGRRVVRQERARHRRQDPRALQDVHGGAERDRVELRRQGRVRPPRLQRGARHARHARSAFELLRPARIRADARAAGRALLRPRHPDQRHRRRHHRASVVRRLARVQEGHPPRRRHREDRRRGRQGLDDRAGDAQAARRRRARPSRSTSSAAATSSRFRRAHARRSPDPDRAGVLHDRRDDRLHPAAGLRREHRPRSEARAARPVAEGHEAAAARHPRQSGRAARSGDQGRRTSSCRAAR